MARDDLLALSADDLAALTNRGTVKRAQREVEEISFELGEAGDGSVTVKWADGVECRLPGAEVVAKGQCTCVATTICRHLVRSVLAYQKRAASQTETAAAAPVPWDPGAFSDDDLARHFRPAVLTRARGLFDEGLLIELVRSTKPSARFHELSCTLRFLVAGDLRYTHCDCADSPPCSHVPLAVWAFRRLPAVRSAGILSTHRTTLPVPAALLDGIEQTLLGLTELGIAGATNAWRDRLVRLEDQCRREGLFWPAEGLGELVQQYERYVQHDARFSAERVVELIGELLIRSDAIRSDTQAVPQVLVRGAQSDHVTELGSARYIGLGCGARVGRRSVELTAYLQDADSGSVVAVGRDFPDPPAGSADPAKDLWQLAQTPVVKGVSLSALGAGQMLVQGGKRSADYRLVIGRARASVNPQAFNWEKLRAPLLAEDFAEVQARLGGMPPASLRPRQVADHFFVCPVAGVESVQFETAGQSVEAVLVDAAGNRALLTHPYTSRGREGAELLLDRLDRVPLRFIAGSMRTVAGGLVVHPVCLVFQEGAARVGVQPWIARFKESSRTGANRDAAITPDDGKRVPHFVAQLLSSLGQLLLLGLMRCDVPMLSHWQQQARHGEALGFSRLGTAIGSLAEALAGKARQRTWDWQPAGHALLQLVVLIKLAEDLAETS